MKARNLVKAALLVPGLLGAMALGCKEDDPGGGTPTAGTGGGAGMGGSGTGGMGGASATCAAETPIMADITTDTSWNCPKYILKRRIFVAMNAKLTIAAGTHVLGDAAASPKAAIIVARGSQLIARGTKDKPIVFSSASPVGSRLGGDWGGIAMLGSAKLNTGDPCASGAAGCKESGIEGIEVSEVRAKFGGTDDTSNCGELQYVRVEFAGAELEPNKELNGLTFGGCGTGTKVSYVQIHRGTDDGIEAFGGTVGFDHVVLSGNEDDSLDWDFGWTGKVQFLVIHQRAGIGDNGIEAAGSPQGETLEPRANPTLYNVTMVGRPDGGRAITFKEGTRGILRNFIIQGFKGDVVDFAAKVVNPKDEWPMHLTIENSLFWMNGNYTNEAMPNAMGVSQDDDLGFDDKAAVEDPARKNKLDVDPMLTNTSDGMPDYVAKNAAIGGQANPTFGDTAANYAGAFKPNDPAPWTAGWTAYPDK